MFPFRTGRTFRKVLTQNKIYICFLKAIVKEWLYNFSHDAHEPVGDEQYEAKSKTVTKE